MANFFKLELDTTPPKVIITAPSYTVPHIDTEIIVSSNEPLDKYQEFFIVDSAGIKHNVIFDYLGDSFRGIVDFGNYALGIATIYARVKDEVHNLSELVTATINIRQPAAVFITIAELTRDIAADENIMPVKSLERQRLVTLIENTREVMLDEMIREIEVSTK
jgi:chemotaxis protein CheY-P-specific phosphatase CheC